MSPDFGLYFNHLSKQELWKTMKRLKTKSALLAFVLVVSAAYSNQTASAAPAQPAADGVKNPAGNADLKASCKTFVQSFYNWYLPKNHNLDNCGTVDKAVDKKKALFSSELLAALQEDIKASDANKDEIVGLDFDPFLNAQDTPEYCIAGSVKQKGADYYCDIYSVYEGKKRPKPDLVAQLANRNGKWVFTNFRYEESKIPENQNLLSILKVLKRDRLKAQQ